MVWLLTQVPPGLPLTVLAESCGLESCTGSSGVDGFSQSSPFLFRAHCHHPALCQEKKKKQTSNIVLSFPSEQWQKPIPLHPWVISQISSWGTVCFGRAFWKSATASSAFLWCLFRGKVKHLVAWPQLPLLILFGSIALPNTTVVCGFGHICLLKISCELIFPILYSQWPLHPSSFLGQDCVTQSSQPSLTLRCSF